MTITENEIIIPQACDFHVHLRQGKMMEAITPLISSGGVGTVFVMPNLQPPIKNTEDALKYKAELVRINPDVEYLMSLYLSPELTPEEIVKASQNGIVGVKSYPRGVTTNSDSGIESYESYYPVFEMMEKVNMVLNLHGEIPSDYDNDVCVLNAEEKFLVHLEKIHKQFPRLRIVLEHATTKAAVEKVLSLGETVGCSITAHHLELVVDDWAGFAHNFCKPVAKFPYDRQALRNVIKQGYSRFFLGSDSAPHPRNRKEGCGPCAAGVFTTPFLLPYLATLFESLGCLEQLANFTSINGAKFYQLDISQRPNINLVRKKLKLPLCYSYIEEDGLTHEVVPFKSGSVLEWQLKV